MFLLALCNWAICVYTPLQAKKSSKKSVEVTSEDEEPDEEDYDEPSEEDEEEEESDVRNFKSSSQRTAGLAHFSCIIRTST